MTDPALFAELRDLCLRSFPERLDQRLSQIESIATGRHPTLAFSLSWREGVRPRVERLLLQHYADDWTWWSSQDGQKAQREWTVVRWLYGCGLPVPKAYALGAQGPAPFLLMERPAGRPIALNANQQAAKDSGPDRRTLTHQDLAAAEQHIDALGTLLAQLHRLSTPASVREVLPRIDVKSELERMATIGQQCEDVALMQAVHELNQDQVEAYPPCVLHGDPQLASLKRDARGITAWLDWENSAMGDPRWDVACVANELQSSQTSPLADRFFECYAGRSGLQLHDIRYWQALTALQRWVMTRQAHSTLGTEAQSRLATQLEPHQKQTWWALARLRETRAAATQPET